MSVHEYDVAIIGGGILGCAMARTLARYCLDVCLFEANSDVGEGATKANSGILHTGFHPRGGSLKGVSCVEGNALYNDIVNELDVPYVRTGALYVAFHEGGLEKINEKRQRAKENGAGVLDVVSGDEARMLEPRLSKRVIAALVAPTTGIISPFELMLGMARNAAANGVRFEFDFEVAAVERSSDGWLLHAADGRVARSAYVVNMAGEEAALLDAQVHAADLKVTPRRGQYVVFDKQDTGAPESVAAGGASGHAGAAATTPIRHVLFQAQEEGEGGTLLAPTVDGNLLAGPTSENVRSFSDNATTQQGIDHVRQVARKLVPDLELGSAITSFAGVRANISNVAKEKKDFVVRASAPGFVSALGIKNPGITCAPALANRALRILAGEGLRLEENVGFDPRDQGVAHNRPFMRCSPSQQRELLSRDARFGHVLCRCEQVTEGDVCRCLHEEIPPRTLDGVKRRLRCGMGRCQGSFCTPRIVSTMADELGCSPTDIAKGEDGGRIVWRTAK